MAYSCTFQGLRPDFTSKLVHRLAFGTPKFYIAPYDKINHRLVNLGCNCDVKSGLNLMSTMVLDRSYENFAWCISTTYNDLLSDMLILNFHFIFDE